MEVNALRILVVEDTKEMEYEFEIDGYSGAIRSWESESIYD